MRAGWEKRLNDKCNERRLKELLAIGCVLGEGVIYACKEDAAVDHGGLYTRNLYEWEEGEWCRIYGRMSQSIAAQNEINERVAKRNASR